MKGEMVIPLEEAYIIKTDDIDEAWQLLKQYEREECGLDEDELTTKEWASEKVATVTELVDEDGEPTWFCWGSDPQKIAGREGLKIGDSYSATIIGF